MRKAAREQSSSSNHEFAWEAHFHHRHRKESARAARVSVAGRIIEWGSILFVWAKRNFIFVDQTGWTSNFVCVFFMHR